MNGEKTLAEKAEEIREAVEDAGYLVTMQDVDDILDRIVELEAENEELRKRAEEAEHRVVYLHHEDCYRYEGPGFTGHRALLDNACPICRRVLGGEK